MVRGRCSGAGGIALAVAGLLGGCATNSNPAALDVTATLNVKADSYDLGSCLKERYTKRYVHAPQHHQSFMGGGWFEVATKTYHISLSNVLVTGADLFVAIEVKPGPAPGQSVVTVRRKKALIGGHVRVSPDVDVDVKDCAGPAS